MISCATGKALLAKLATLENHGYSSPVPIPPLIVDEEQSQILWIVVPLKAFQAFVNGNHEVVNNGSTGISLSNPDKTFYTARQELCNSPLDSSMLSLDVFTQWLSTKRRTPFPVPLPPFTRIDAKLSVELPQGHPRDDLHPN